MIIEMLKLSPRVLTGLLMAIVFIELTIFVVFIRQQTRLKIQWKERERQKKKQQTRIEEIRAEQTQRLRESVINSTWIYDIADFVFQIKEPVKRIEIWKSQLIIETELYLYNPLSRFGIDKELTPEEAYQANKVLYEIIWEHGYRRLELKDMTLYCEIIKVR